MSIPIFCAHTSLIDPRALRPNPANPNRHSAHQVALLASIIQDQGWRNPITVSKRSGLIVRGHGRLEAAMLIGCAAVPVDEQDYASEAEELADLLAATQATPESAGPDKVAAVAHNQRRQQEYGRCFVEIVDDAIRHAH